MSFLNLYVFVLQSMNVFAVQHNAYCLLMFKIKKKPD